MKVLTECIIVERSLSAGRPPQYRRDDVADISLASGDDEWTRAAQTSTVPGTESLTTLHFDPTIRASICFSQEARQDRGPPEIRAILLCDVSSQLGP